MINILTLLFPVAAIGLSISAYLVKERKIKSTPVCLIGGNCKTVLLSKYNKTFRVNNDILGIIFYLTIITMIALILIGIEPFRMWQKIIIALITIGSLMSLRFIYIQWKILRTWCFWCLMSALTIGTMELLLIIYGFNLAL